jgi:hypothetical protein
MKKSKKDYESNQDERIEVKVRKTLSFTRRALRALIGDLNINIV